MRQDMSSRSRITHNERAELQAEGKRACMTFAAAVYRRFARKKRLYDADDRFFDAALHVFGNDLGSKASRLSPANVMQRRRNDAEEGENSDAESSASGSDSGFGSETASTSQVAPPAEDNLFEIVIKDIMKTPYQLPAWTKPFSRTSAIGLLRGEPFGTKIRTMRVPLVEWTSHDGKRGKREVRAMNVQWDRGLKDRRWRNRLRKNSKKDTADESKPRRTDSKRC